MRTSLGPLGRLVIAVLCLGALAAPTRADEVIDPNIGNLTPCQAGQRLRQAIQACLNDGLPNCTITLLPRIGGGPDWSYRVCEPEQPGSIRAFPLISASAERRLVIQGSGQQITIERDAAAPPLRMFEINGGYSFELRNIALKNGRSSEGAGILFQPLLDPISGEEPARVQLILDNCLIENNHATVGSGGGISASIASDATTGEVRLLNTTFRGNSAVRQGGGAYVLALALYMGGGAFDDNDVTGGASSEGGGLYYNKASLDDPNSLLFEPLPTDPAQAPPRFINNSSAGDGGGLWLNGASNRTQPMHLVAYNNSARRGGGMFNKGSTVRFRNCDFGLPGQGNNALEGAGLYSDDSLSKYVRCNISGNTAAATDGGTGHGGGAFIIRNRPLFSECCFRDNVAQGTGGGAYMTGKPSEPSFIDSLFAGNTARNGGGIGIAVSRPFLFNCVIANNRSWEAGGGIWGGAFPSSAIILHCTIARNQAIAPPGGGPIAQRTAGTGIHTTPGFAAEILGTIIWNNGIPRTDNEAGSFSSPDVPFSRSFGKINYSLIQTPAGTDPYPDTLPAVQNTNINSDPLFVTGSTTADVHLQADSPAIDRASRAAAQALLDELAMQGRLPQNDALVGFDTTIVYKADYDDPFNNADPNLNEFCPEGQGVPPLPTPRLAEVFGFPPPGCEADMGADETPYGFEVGPLPDRTVCVGGAQCFDVVATLTPPGATGTLQFRWFRVNSDQSRTPISHGGRYSITSAGLNSTLCITNAVLADAGTYAVVVSRPGITDPACVLERTATLTVIPPITLEPPPNKVVCLGGSQSWTVVPVFPPGCQGTVRWYRGQSLVAEGATFTITNAAPAAAGEYRVCVGCDAYTDAKCPDQCYPFTVTVLDPLALSDPPDKVVCTGGTQEFSTTAIVPAGCTPVFMWSKGAQILSPVPGQIEIVNSGNTSTLRVLNADAADAGAYQVCVNCAQLTLAKCPLACQAFNLNVIDRPVIATPPPDKVICVQGSQSWLVTGTFAAGCTPSFQWFKGNTPLISGPRVQIINNGVTSELRILDAQLSDAGQYRVCVTCANYGEAKCVPNCYTFNVAVYERPTVNDPGDKVVCLGGVQEFTATGTFPSGCSGVLTWKKNGQTIVPVPNRIEIVNSGNGSTLRILNAEASDESANYQVCASCSNIPDTKCLEFCQTFALDVLDRPLVTVVPADKIVCRGGTQEWTVSGSFPPGCTPTFVWRKNGAPITPVANRFEILTNGSTSTLRILNAQDADAGPYDVCVSCGNITQAKCPPNCYPFNVTVLPPLVLTDPGDKVACPGGVQEWTSVATLPGQCNGVFTWRKNGQVIVPAPGRFEIITAGNTSTLRILNIVQGDESSNYQVCVSCSNVTAAKCPEYCQQFGLDVRDPPTISVAPTDKSICPGGSQVWTVSGTFVGDCTPVFVWRKNGQIITPIPGRIEIVTNGATSTLRILNAVQEDAGQYDVCVSCGNITQAKCPPNCYPFRVLILPPLTITPPPDKLACTGGMQEFNSSAVVPPGCTPVFTWKKGGSPIASGGRFLIQTNGSSSSLKIVNATAADTGAYSVCVSCSNIPQSKCIEACGTFQFTVVPPPSLPDAPSGTYLVCDGNPRSFTVTPNAASQCGPVVRWYRGDALVHTGTTFTLNPASLTDTGDYRVCVDCDALAEAKCEPVCYPFRIRVVPRPSVVVTGECACINQSFTMTANVTADPAPVNVTYKWFREGDPNPIPGATGKTYTINPVLASDIGAKFKVEVSVDAAVTGCPSVQSELFTITECPAGQCFGCVDCCWNNGLPDGRDGQLSQIPKRSEFPPIRTANDFWLESGQMHNITKFVGTLATNSNPNLPYLAQLELYEDCGGAPGDLIATYLPEERRLGGVFQDNPDLRIVEFVFNPEDLWLRGGRTYWISLQGIGDGNPFYESYWLTSLDGRIMGSVPRKQVQDGMDGVSWMPLDECCIDCTELAFCLECESCPIYYDGRPPAPVAGGARSERSINTQRNSRAADDFVVKPCEDLEVCYLEGYVYSNCVGFTAWLDIYPSDCDEPDYVLGSTPLYVRRADKIVDLGYDVMIGNTSLRAYRIEFYPGPDEAYPHGLRLAGGMNYWVSISVQDSFSAVERAYFAFADGPCLGCAGQLNDGVQIAPGRGILTWTKVNSDFAFLVAGHAIPLTPPSPLPGLNTATLCSTDADGDGSATVADVFIFLRTWFSGCP